MRQIVSIILVIAAIVCLVVVGFTYEQTQNEKNSLESDLQYRSTLFAETLKNSIEPYLSNPENKSYIQGMVDSFNQRQRVEGIMVFDNKETLIASSSGMPADIISSTEEVVTNSMDEDKATAKFVRTNNKSHYIFALPLHQNDSIIGSLVMIQSAGFINDRITSIWYTNLIRLTLQITLISVALVLILQYFFFKPILSVTKVVKERGGNMTPLDRNQIKNSGFLSPLFLEIQKVQQNLQIARESASLEARLRHEKDEAPWTEMRLKEYIKNVLHGRQIIAVSNREPYIHAKANGKKTYSVPASGMVTAIEPIMRACGGTWVAYGSGEGDKEAVDENSRIAVPPDDPKYTLRRVWLTPEQEKGFYQNFSNEGIWPLCHLVHTRPAFRLEDWKQYRQVNQIFAQTVVAEAKKSSHPIIFIQDFHLALLPGMIKSQLPGAKIGIFWHIPWPNPEVFSICPYRKDLIDGMLGADLIGFHTQQHCNNFIDTVNRELESLVDTETTTIIRHGHKTLVKPFPISISFTGQNTHTDMTPEERAEILKSYGTTAQYIGLGVDRLDYTKGILERFVAVAQFLEAHPEFREKFSLIQISSPSRTGVQKYREFADDVKQKADEINKTYAKGGWKPIIFVPKHHDHEQLNRLYKIADVCLVTSLHDGMNLVAKEFIGAREDEGGMLILSKFAGAAKQLEDALIVNPYDFHETGEAIYQALTMSDTKKQKIMQKLRQKVLKYNIYRWSYEYLREIHDIT